MERRANDRTLRRAVRFLVAAYLVLAAGFIGGVVIVERRADQGAAQAERVAAEARVAAEQVREVACDNAAFNGGVIAYYQAILDAPVAAGIEREIRGLLGTAQRLAPRLNAACEGRPIPPVRGG